MSQVASLNGAARAFGFGPPAQADRGGRAPAGLIGAAAFAAVLVLLPILVTVVQAAGVSAQGAVDLLMRPLVGRLLVNTVGLVVAASATCAAIGTATAWLVERTDVPGRKVWAVLAVAPLGHSAIHLELCLGLAEQRAAGFRRRPAGGYLRLLSARLSAGRRRAARSRSGAGRNRQVAGSWRVGMLLPRRGAATSPGALRRRIAGGARCPDRVRRLCAAALSHLHDRALRPIPDGTGRAGILGVGARAHRSVSHLRGRRTEPARPGALRARRLRLPTDRGAGAARVDPAAGAAGVRGADDGDDWRALGHDRLLADAARSGRHLAGRAILAGSLRRDARFGRLWTGRSRRGPGACGAGRLPRDALPEPAVDRCRADRLSRAGRAGHRRRAGVHFADGPDDPPALSKRGAARYRLCNSVSAVRSRRGPLGAGAGPTRTRGGRPLARARLVRGYGCASWRRWRGRALEPGPPWCSSSSPPS